MENPSLGDCNRNKSGFITIYLTTGFPLATYCYHCLSILYLLVFRWQHTASLGRFEARDVSKLGRFVLGCFVLNSFVLGRFVFVRFVGIPKFLVWEEKNYGFRTNM
jgi:hypothetical protein